MTLKRRTFNDDEVTDQHEVMTERDEIAEVNDEIVEESEEKNKNVVEESEAKDEHVVEENEEKDENVVEDMEEKDDENVEESEEKDELIPEPKTSSAKSKVVKIFTEEDIILLLQEYATFQSAYGTQNDWVKFHNTVKDKLSNPFSKSQVLEKMRSMKKKIFKGL